MRHAFIYEEIEHYRKERELLLKPTGKLFFTIFLPDNQTAFIWSKTFHLAFF